MTKWHAADLAAAVDKSIREAEPSRAASWGFGPMAHDDRAGPLRRANARTVLVAEHLLETLGTSRREPIVLMKGLEAAQLYPAPHMRHFRDVDVLVRDPESLWSDCVDEGYVYRPSRRIDIDHHHLPALRAPFGPIGLEVHHRPNLPGWAEIESEWIIGTAEPSRTGITGVLRPRDDIHALLMAFHAWKSGFTRPRDLYDAVLFAARSDIPVEETARSLGLGRFWKWTEYFTQAIFLDATDIRSRIARRFLPGDRALADRKRVRLTSPLLVANPVKVTRGHYREYRLAREVRRPQV